MKKKPGTYTIGFNMADPAHRAVVELLEQQGPRRKAQFLVNAVQHYAHCPETPDITSQMAVPSPPDKAELEALVLHILQKSGYLPAEGRTAPAQQAGGKSFAAELQMDTRASELIGDDAMTAIANSIAAFRGQ